MREKKYVGALDSGTTGTRFILFDQEANLIASAYKEHQQYYPANGYVEHSPAEILENSKAVIKEAITQVKIDPKTISSIGITNQRETTIVWNQNGTPVANAVVWQDVRTEKICEQLQEGGHEEDIVKKTGLRAATYFSGPKISWLLEKHNLKQKAASGDLLFGTVDSWLIWNLTHERTHVIDPTNASRTMLMDLTSLEWSDDMLSLLQIPDKVLPVIRPSSDPDFYGTCNVLEVPIPVCGDLGDQQAALFGQGCFEAGMAKNTYGTGCFLLINTGKSPIFSQNGLLSTVGFSFSKKETFYALEGSVAIAGAAIQWLRDQMGFIQTASESEELASSVPDSAGVVFVPAFVGLFAPHWDSKARGTIFGLTRATNQAHITRAVLEAICWSTRDVLEAMKIDGELELKELRVDGGAAKNNLLLQIQADYLGVNCVRPQIEETTSLGAAYMAGLATGFWKDLSDIQKKWKMDRMFLPKIKGSKREEKYQIWKKAINRCRNWLD
ncbi:MAG: glycerol kinase GlpK [Candidatus Hodarchaeota archaeon]